VDFNKLNINTVLNLPNPLFTVKRKLSNGIIIISGDNKFKRYTKPFKFMENKNEKLFIKKTLTINIIKIEKILKDKHFKTNIFSFLNSFFTLN